LEKNEKDKLVASALEAAVKAYAPYSNFHVGAAAVDAEGNVYTGCNVENASYGLTCCAERVALFKAVSDGAAPIKALAIVSPDNDGYIAPCGACRQVIYELASDAVILLADKDGAYVEQTPDQLLPGAFKLDS